MTSVFEFLPARRPVRAMDDDDLVWTHAGAAFRVKQFNCHDREAERALRDSLAAEIERRKL